MITKNAALAASFQSFMLSIDVCPGIPAPLVNGFPPSIYTAIRSGLGRVKRGYPDQRTRAMTGLVRVVRVVRAIFNPRTYVRARVCFALSLYSFFLSIKENTLTTLTQPVIARLSALTRTLTCPDLP